MIRLTNRLGDTASPYLRQHAAQPVDWQPWDERAFALARGRQRPILLSIGYSACHWCHVMARESFEDEATAALMNELFVNIKLDREERPDLDRLYLSALARLGRASGWPLTAFLTPDGEPFAGGGYFPPIPAYGLPDFRSVLRQQSGAFHDDPAACVRRGQEALAQATALPRPGGSRAVSAGLLDRVAHDLARSVDWLYGGFGIQAPKFLQAGGHEILLRAWARSGEPGLLDAVIGSVTKICDSAVFDHVGGAFHRYAADDRFLVPHFEKMLCDNSVMVSLLARLWQTTGNAVFALRVETTLDWMLREMRLPDGGFAASLAAETDGREGRFYTWTAAEIRDALGERYDAFAAGFDLCDDGPFDGKNVIYRRSDTCLAEPPELLRLLEHRARRTAPARDDKMLADWNGLAICALAEAGLVFGRPDWIKAAETCFSAVVATLATPDGLRHCALDGDPGQAGFLDDYANMARAALALYEASGDERLVARACGWVDLLDSRFWDDSQGGYFLTESGTTTDGARQMLIDETTAPAGNGTLLGVLPRLALLSGDDRYRRRAEAILRRFADRLSRASLAAATALNNSLALAHLVLIVLVGDPDPAGLRLTAARRYIPDRLLIPRANAAAAPDHPAHGKTPIDGRATAYVCVGPTCLAPVTDADALGATLDRAITLLASHSNR
jgi:uncharacterized protein YyaL (SSP411 family)